MENFTSRADADFDVLVAGAGPVGLSAALACAQIGLRTCAIGKIDRRNLGRTVALLAPSLQFYRSLGLGDAIEAASAPLEIMRIVDDTDSLFRTRPVSFVAAEIGVDAFGRNIENATLAALLEERAGATANLALIDDLVARYDFAPECVQAQAGARAISAKLLIAADGRNSPGRVAAGIEAQTWTYPQTALTAILGHDRPHRNASTEFHTRGGPFTLVPLLPTADERHRSSLVWMMTPRDARRRVALAPSDFVYEAERQAHSLLGKMRLLSSMGALPMTGLRACRLTGARIALVGDAAHGFPPIGAQGLNLGLRDVACLAETAVRTPDPGAAAVLDAYARRRRLDVALRVLGVDLVNRSLPAAVPPIDFARGLGLAALGAIGPLRRAAMRIGLAPPWGAPAAMRLRRD